MDLGLYIAASGMVAEQTRQAQLSNDLANASTPGYKADQSPQHSFGALLLSNTATGQTIGSMNTGVQLGKTFTDMTPAGMHQTGQPLDFGIVGSGFFAVRTPQGVRYTRDGQFTASAQGQLVDGAGDTVLNQSGAPIQVAPTAPWPRARSGSSTCPGRSSRAKTSLPAPPPGAPKGRVRQGVLEESGVNPARTMVEMIGSLRTFQSGQQAIQAIDQTLQAASTQVGSLNGSS